MSSRHKVSKAKRYVVRVDGMPARSGALREMQRLAGDIRKAHRGTDCEIYIATASGNDLVHDYSTRARRESEASRERRLTALYGPVTRSKS